MVGETNVPMSSVFPYLAEILVSILFLRSVDKLQFVSKIFVSLGRSAASSLVVLPI